MIYYVSTFNLASNIMNKKQFLRFSLVLVAPIFALSWWMSQQDFILERGQQVTCDVEANSCASVFSFPLKHYKEIQEGIHTLSYSTHDGESLVFLQNFKYPFKAMYFDESKNQEVEAPELTATMMEKYGCKIGGFYGFTYSCSVDYLPFNQSLGKLKFQNDSDAVKFQNLISVAKSDLNKSETTRLWLALLIFSGIVLSYLLLAFIIKFVVFGLKPNDSQ
jgi:hypothetical protein